MTDKNPFQQFGDTAVSTVHKRKLAKENMVPKTALEKKQVEQDKLHELWLTQFNKQKQALLKGEYEHHARMLCCKLENLREDDGDVLIEMARIWQAADRPTRNLVLHLISSAMTDLRCRMQLPAFDDPLPYEEDNAFMVIRRILA